jgi:hypothetical protein
MTKAHFLKEDYLEETPYLDPSHFREEAKGLL